MVCDPVACLSVIQAARPDIQIRSLTPIETGWDFFVLDANDEWIFRFPRRPEVRSGLVKEAVLLAHLTPLLPVAVPQFERGAPGVDSTPAWVCYPKIPGVPLGYALAVNPAARPVLAQHIGLILSTLHSVTLPWTVHRLLPRRTLLDWKRHYLDLYYEFRRQVFPLLDPATQDKAASLWEGYLRPRDRFRFEMALIHSDLGPEHILCDPHTARVTGLIDWEDACTGDPALDFVGLLQAGGKDFVGQVLKAYQRDLGMNFWPRLHFYTKIVPFYEIQFGLMTGDPVRTQAGLDQLHRSLDD